jgi:hypothetical protein
MERVSKRRVTIATWTAIFSIVLILDLATYPHPPAAHLGPFLRWIGLSVLMAALLAAGIVAFLWLFGAFLYVFVKCWWAFSHLELLPGEKDWPFPFSGLRWVVAPYALTETGLRARRILFMVYGPLFGFLLLLFVFDL